MKDLSIKPDLKQSSLTVRLFSWFYSQNIHGWRPDGVSAGIGWVALNLPAESHCAAVRSILPDEGKTDKILFRFLKMFD